MLRALLLTLIACQPDPAHEAPTRAVHAAGPGAARTGGLVEPVAGDPPAAAALLYEEYVIRLGARGLCPQPTEPGWTVEALFDELAHEGDDDDDDDGVELGRYCVYEDQAGGAPSPFAGLDLFTGEDQDVSTFVGVPGSVGIPGRLLLGSSSVDPAALADLHLARFRAGAGAPTRLTGRRGAPAVPPSRQPRIVLLDTVDDSRVPFPYDLDLFQEHMSHGLALAVAAAELTCPDGQRCPVQIATAGALSRRNLPDRGGADPGLAWGTPGDLARAVHRALRAWRQDHADGRVGPLVLNLSVAWHPFFGGGVPGAYEIGAEGATVPFAGGVTGTFSWDDVDPEQWPPDVKAAFEALRLARCEGALIFAAAGNASGGPRGTSGPMLPAAWEAYPMERLACPRGQPMPEPALPLLNAVGGVDLTGTELSVSRPDSRPKLLAYGDHYGVAPNHPLVDDPSQALSGTSVATIVASSAAAMIAARHPQPTAGNVLRVMLDLGTPAGPVAPWAEAATGAIRPDLIAGPTAGARVVRVCAPLAGRGYTCPAPAPALAGFGEGDDPAVAELDWSTPDNLAICDGWTVHRDPIAGGTAAFNPCPHLTRWSPDIAPWVLPQPPTDGCSSCFIDLGARRLGLATDRVSGWTDLTLVVTSPTGRRAYSLPPLPAGPSVTWSWRPGALPADATAVGLTGVLDDRAMVIPMAIVRP